MTMGKNRCAWVTEDPLYIDYHDHEWGIPFAQLEHPPYDYEDQYLFEMLTLEGAQAGLNWLTILQRRENYRAAFDHFDIQKVSRYDEQKIAQLLTNKGIIRNRLKVHSVVNNAKAFLAIQREFGQFRTYLWNFVDHKPVINDWKTASDVPAYTKLSTALSKDLKRRGFSFVGPTICYAFMQAVGLVNDHTKNCFLYKEK